MSQFINAMNCASIGLSIGTILMCTVGMSMIDGTTDDDVRLRWWLALAAVLAIVGGVVGWNL